MSSDDENEQTPFDPSILFNNIMKKENDIKVDGNKVYFYKSVSRESVLQLITTLKNTAKKLTIISDQIGSKKPPIILFINSEGGDLFAGLSAMDHIKNMKYPVYTVIDGMVASAGTFISLAGKKRFMMKSSWVLIHQVKSWMGGMFSHEELKDSYENSDNFMKSLNKLYSENTKITKKTLDKFFKHDLYINYSDALKIGIVESEYSDDLFDLDFESICTKNGTNSNNSNTGSNTDTKKRKRIIE